jgi:hypothetical protein
MRPGGLSVDDVSMSRAGGVEEHAPPPALLAAWLVLGRAPMERVPWWAAQWLVDGRDGAALRELAGLDGRDVRAVRDLLPAVLEELSVALPTDATAAALVVFDDLARRCLSGTVAERWVAQKVDEVVISAGYSTEVMDLPLGRLYGTDDAWSGGWGPSVEELKALVRAACGEQIGETPLPGGSSA